MASQACSKSWVPLFVFFPSSSAGWSGFHHRVTVVRGLIRLPLIKLKCCSQMRSCRTESLFLRSELAFPLSLSHAGHAHACDPAEARWCDGRWRAGLCSPRLGVQLRRGDELLPFIQQRAEGLQQKAEEAAASKNEASPARA